MKRKKPTLEEVVKKQMAKDESESVGAVKAFVKDVRQEQIEADHQQVLEWLKKNKKKVLKTRHLDN